MIRDFISELENCGDTDGRFEIICKFAKACDSSDPRRKHFIKEHFSLHRQRRIREYINDGWYVRLIYNFS